MNLLTRCPECQTLFRVVPDQLRLSEGWVRCGQCDAVFDATANLNDGSETQVEDEPVLPVPPDSPEPFPEVHETVEIPAPQALAPFHEPIAVSVDADEIRSASRPVKETETPLDVSFIQQPAKAAVVQRPWVRRTLVLSAFLLGLVLLLQLVLTDRDRIAASEPALRPALLALCDVFQCEVRPLRQIESIVIENSSFNKIRGDVFRLTLTLKNTSSIPLAAPSIELALTDMQDQPVMRRVFQPAELGNAANTIVAGAESVGTLALSIKQNGTTDRIAGYRVLAFYP